jgi:hypothetical protein
VLRCDVLLLLDTQPVDRSRLSVLCGLAAYWATCPAPQPAALTLHTHHLPAASRALPPPPLCLPACLPACLQLRFEQDFPDDYDVRLAVTSWAKAHFEVLHCSHTPDPGAGRARRCGRAGSWQLARQPRMHAWFWVCLPAHLLILQSAAAC